jgi:2-oxoglutarate dehydrogenase E2 component (dihydrolipoamide succinyltransferase)
VYITPLVRKMAAEYNVDLGSIKAPGRRPDPQAGRAGCRVGGREGREAAQRPAAAEPQQHPGRSHPGRSRPTTPAARREPLRGKTEPMTRLRKVIAKRMVESLQVSAQLTTWSRST